MDPPERQGLKRIGLGRRAAEAVAAHPRLAAERDATPVPLPATPAAEREMRGAPGLLRLLQKFGWLAIAAALAGAAAATIAVAALPDRYEATALILMDSTASRLLGGGDPREAETDSKVELLKSDHLAQLLVDRLALQDDPDFAPRTSWRQKIAALIPGGLTTGRKAAVDAADATPLTARPVPAPGLPSRWSDRRTGPVQLTPAARQLQQALTVRRRGMSDVVAVTVASAHPARAAELANGYAEAFIEDEKAERSRALEATSRALQEKAADPADADAQGAVRPPGDAAARAELLARYRSALGSDIRLAAPALAPDRPAGPPRGTLVAAGALAGLGLGLGLALLLETRRRSPQTPAEIEALTGLANLGALPAVRRIGRHSPADRVSDRPGSAYAACMRRLLVSLDMGRANPGVVLVTSARRREGRTTTALALGRSAAAAGMNAVVIDCDSIEPALARAASLEPGRGMADLLSEPGHLPRLASVSMIDPRSGCSIVAAGSPGAGSAALLRAERLRAILAEARTNFDMVIIDGPCVESAAEALVLAKLAGTVLMVVRAGRTGPEHILSCQRQLERAGAPAIATVLNAAGSDALRPSPLP